MESESRKAEVTDEELLDSLKRYPGIRSRVVRLLEVVENTGGDLKRADEAEERTIEELRAMGQALLGAWGQRLSDEEAKLLDGQGQVVHQVKKTALAQHLWPNRSSRTGIPPEI